MTHKPHLLSQLYGNLECADDLCRAAVHGSKTLVDNDQKRHQLPQIAREQLVINYATYFEAFLFALLQLFFQRHPEALRSTRISMKDDELVDLILEGRVLESLVERKAREVMRGSIHGWIEFFERYGFALNGERRILIELFLIRNCLLHNRRSVNRHLEKAIGGERFAHGKRIIVSPADTKRYRDAMGSASKRLWDRLETM